MEDGGGRREEGGWRMEDGGWRREDRRSRIEDLWSRTVVRQRAQISIHDHPFSILYPLSSILYPQSSILNPLSSILYPLSSFHPFALRPVVALDKDLTVGGHAGFGISDRALELQLDSNNLLYALIAEVSIFRRERGFRVDPRDVSIDRLIWIGIKVDPCRLPRLDVSDLSFRDKASEIHLTEIQQRNNGRARGYDFSRLSGSSHDRAVKRRGDYQIAPVRLGLRQLSAGLLAGRVCARDFRLLLHDLFSNRLGLRTADTGVRQICLRDGERASQSFISTFGRRDRCRLLSRV